MIPKIIHYCWFGHGKKNALTKKCIKSWGKYCPDYQIIEWNEENYDVSKNQYMKQAYEAKKWAFVSDYARLDIIYEHGGIYLDTDVELVKSPDELLKNTAFAGLEQHPNGYVTMNSGLGFGAEAQDPVIGDLLHVYDELSFLKEDGSFDLTPCPEIQSKQLKKYGFVRENKIQQVGSLTLYPSSYFCPERWKEIISFIQPETYSIHHYSASWVSSKRTGIAGILRKFKKNRLKGLLKINVK